ncbi:MAG: hypothetical protein IT431_07555 [Phycisphaerales bacterium]|nr:hypothetical protein [Phycisphaerales bacterium]
MLLYGKIAILPYVEPLTPPPDTDFTTWQTDAEDWRIRAWVLLGATIAAWWVFWRFSPAPVSKLLLWVAGPRRADPKEAPVDEHDRVEVE